MDFFEKTASFDLFQYFDGNHPDVRIQTRDLFDRTRRTVEKEKQIGLEVVLLIGCLERINAAVNLGLDKREILAEKLGLTVNQYWKRAQAGRVLMHFPEFVDLVREGKTHVSHLAMLAPKITDANKDIFFNEVAGKSEREIRELLGSVRKDGSRSEQEPVVEVRLQLKKSELELLDRAREVLSSTGEVPSESEALVKALGDLLEKRDPMRKAQRAETRRKKKDLTSVRQSESETAGNPKDSVGRSSLKQMPLAIPNSTAKYGSDRSPIPARAKHHVIQRYQGMCTYIGTSGKPCGCRVGIQIDHVLPVAFGGDNDPANLRLLCRSHNVMEAKRLLGAETMEQYCP